MRSVNLISRLVPMLLACILALGGCAPRQGTAVAPTFDAASNDWQRTLAAAQVANDEQAWNLFDDFLVQYPTGLWTEAAKAQRDLLTEALYAQTMKQGNRALTGNNPAEADAAFKRALHWKPADPWATQAQTAAQALAKNPNRPVFDNMPSLPTKVGGATDYVVEGRGFGKVQLGMTEAELRDVLGPPTSVSTNGSIKYVRYDALRISCTMSDRLLTIQCNENCALRFQSGLGVGSSMEDLFSIFGRPKNDPPYAPMANTIGLVSQNQILLESSTRYFIQYQTKGAYFWLSKPPGAKITSFWIRPARPATSGDISDTAMAKAPVSPAIPPPFPSQAKPINKPSPPAQTSNIRKILWGPEQATGTPDAEMGSHGSKAWVSYFSLSKPDGKTMSQWLVLDYNQPVQPVAIHVYESYRPGELARVTAFTGTKQEITLWSGTDPTPKDARSGVSKLLILQPFVTQRIKLYLHPGARTEIDAVALLDSTGRVYWAESAYGSCRYRSSRLESDVIPDMIGANASVDRKNVPPSSNAPNNQLSLRIGSTGRLGGFDVEVLHCSESNLSPGFKRAAPAGMKYFSAQLKVNPVMSDAKLSSDQIRLRGSVGAGEQLFGPPRIYGKDLSGGNYEAMSGTIRGGEWNIFFQVPQAVSTLSLYLLAGKTTQ